MNNKRQIRQIRREYAEEWISIRKSLRSCGNYYSSAVLRNHLRLIEKCWKSIHPLFNYQNQIARNTEVS
jgi:hypothetical protein